MAPKRPKRPKDFNQAAKFVIDVATSARDDKPDINEKNPAAVELGRRGGKKGGVARAKALSEKERSEIARRAARARWKDND
jgi:hypothetical protein